MPHAAILAAAPANTSVYFRDPRVMRLRGTRAEWVSYLKGAFPSVFFSRYGKGDAFSRRGGVKIGEYAADQNCGTMVLEGV